MHSFPSVQVELEFLRTQFQKQKSKHFIRTITEWKTLNAIDDNTNFIAENENENENGFWLRQRFQEIF